MDQAARLTIVFRIDGVEEHYHLDFLAGLLQSPTYFIRSQTVRTPASQQERNAGVGRDQQLGEFIRNRYAFLADVEVAVLQQRNSDEGLVEPHQFGERT